MGFMEKLLESRTMTITFYLLLCLLKILLKRGELRILIQNP